VNAPVPAEVLIGLGGNVGDVRLTIARAITRLCDGTGIRLLKRSADYRTPPWGVTDQPPFINACISVATELAPRAVLDRALAVERALGRDRAREERWGPRRIDIDLLAYGDLAIDEPGLELPHPRLMQRAFVLVPLAEIVPDRIVAGQHIAEAATRVEAGGIERLPPVQSTP
jgi:2-amino-4-hydroxy-6-hydroxymethyldihydropteridine diphosphokinase